MMSRADAARIQTRRVATIATNSSAPTTHSADAEKLHSRMCLFSCDTYG
jgi:hypothetical protein